jgi:hypothetical protein
MSLSSGFRFAPRKTNINFPQYLHCVSTLINKVPEQTELSVSCNSCSAAICWAMAAFFFQFCNSIHIGRHSVVGMATCYGLDDRGVEGSEFESRLGQKFSPLKVVEPGSGVHPMCIENSFPGGKVAGT